MELWTALLLGFFGSFHCVGMCGPIAKSIPRSSSSMGTLTLNAVIYNSGRILTYSIFGLIFGFLGAHITIAGLQGSLSIILGVIIVAGVIINRYFKFRLVYRLSAIGKTCVDQAPGKISSHLACRWV